MTVQTLQDAVKFIEENIDSATKDFLKSKKPDELIVELHHSLGRYIRNTLNLWDLESPLVNWFNDTYGIAHADDLSSVVLKKLAYKLQNSEDESWLASDIARFKRHWKSMSCTDNGIQHLK